MKKILATLIFFCLFLNANSFEEKIVKEKFKVKSLIIDLPSGGEWKLFMYRGTKVYNAYFKTYFLSQFKNDVLSELVQVFEGHGDRDYPDQSNAFFYNFLYNADKIRGCKKRFEYYIFELNKSGAVGNCFVIRNWDPYKEIFDPNRISTDYTDMNYPPKIFQKYITENNIELPKMMLRSESYYYDKFDQGRIYIVYRMINPEVNGAPLTQFNTETTSEYFVQNLDKYYLHKKYLNNWSKLQAMRHDDFEKKLKVRQRNRLNLSQYIGDGIVDEMKNTNLIQKKDSNTIKKDDIKDLEELYKSGILSEEEFEKAKKLILN